jgi:hypothetical protein
MKKMSMYVISSLDNKNALCLNAFSGDVGQGLGRIFKSMVLRERWSLYQGRHVKFWYGLVGAARKHAWCHQPENTHIYMQSNVWCTIAQKKMSPAGTGCFRLHNNGDRTPYLLMHSQDLTDCATGLDTHTVKNLAKTGKAQFAPSRYAVSLYARGLIAWKPSNFLKQA